MRKSAIGRMAKNHSNAESIHSHRRSSSSTSSTEPPRYSVQPSGSSIEAYHPSAASDLAPGKSSQPFGSLSLPSSSGLSPADLEAGLLSDDVEPPEFSVYQASYKADSLGNITSHDSHLNTDGEALCRFILLHISSPPELIVKLSGTHEDVRTETTTEYVNGRTEYRTREHRQTVTDFSFTMQVESEPAVDLGIRRLYIVGDGEVVGRGRHRRDRGRWENGKDLGLLNHISNDEENMDLPGRETSRVGFKERRKADKIAKETRRLGYPPFVPSWMFPRNTFTCEPTRPPDHLLGPDWQDKCAQYFDSVVRQGYYRHQKLNRQASTLVERELRQWCDDYCASHKHLKELRVQKAVFGWNLSLLEEELLKLLRSTPHLSSTHFSVDFYTTSAEIVVRPVNFVSKIFSLPGLFKFLLTITLIYPILWLMRYLFLGADYDVVRVAYPLVCWHEPDQQPSEAHLRGASERDWFAANQASISRACQNSKIGVHLPSKVHRVSKNKPTIYRLCEITSNPIRACKDVVSIIYTFILGPESDGTDVNWEVEAESDGPTEPVFKATPGIARTGSVGPASRHGYATWLRFGYGPGHGTGPVGYLDWPRLLFCLGRLDERNGSSCWLVFAGTKTHSAPSSTLILYIQAVRTSEHSLTSSHTSSNPQHNMLIATVFLGAMLALSSSTLALPVARNTSVYKSTSVYSTKNLNTKSGSSSRVYNADKVYNSDKQYDPVTGVKTSNLSTSRNVVKASNTQNSITGASASKLSTANSVYNANRLQSPGASSTNVQGSNNLFNSNTLTNPRTGVSYNNVNGSNKEFGYQHGNI
ncbi:hypothetical protein PCANC_00252 [Puccinia coronata f. sp. avenae]|uniref:Uncharacterized protein n=1 Tax=Puccinia coronata f. sp. avenae TaxID=200324 RepID=A0A2N5W9D2_9BASI|nr:hypothetical protein PCANC_00252 [Puccinia coronata f. sp. avenae]